MTHIYKIADKIIKITSLHKDIHEYCRDYRYEGKPDFLIETYQADIEFEREKSACENIAEGHEIINYSDGYLEELAIYRKISERMPAYDTFLFHGSAVAVDDFGYMFTAPSGTGKSTHAKLWCDFLGNKAIMVNDDKPFIKITQNKAIVYGTPFNGKHRRGNNISVPLKAICLLERSEANHIHKITANEAYTKLLQQTYRPLNPLALTKTLKLLDELMKRVDFYHLYCNMDIEAAKISYNTMKG